MLVNNLIDIEDIQIIDLNLQANLKSSKFVAIIRKLKQISLPKLV